MSDIDAIVAELGGENLINKYMMSYIKDVCARGMDDEMCREAVEDAIIASEFGVGNDADFQIFYYIDHFVDLESEEITGSLSAADKKALKKAMFGQRHEADFSNLVTYRALVLKWMKDRKLGKVAYYNSSIQPFVYNRYNLDDWKRLALEIGRLVTAGKAKLEALTTMTKNLDIRERADFTAWYDFNFGKNRRLYNINDKVKDLSRRASVGDSKLIKVASIFEDGTGYWAVDLPRPKPAIIADEDKSPVDRMIRDQKASDINDVKNKMIGRTFAIDKLLEKYRDSLTEEQIDQIEDALNTLRKKIRKLKLASIINDTMIKTARLMRSNDFVEGSEVLLKLAAPPGEGITDKTDNKPDRTDSPAAKRERSIDELKKEDLKPVLDKLYDVSVRLKRRNIVREIAGIDLDLYNLNVASFFPELTDAQAKLIEAFGYASNKIEDVIPKLRSVSTEPPIEYDPSEEVAQEISRVKPTVTTKPVAAPSPPGAATPQLPTKTPVK